MIFCHCFEILNNFFLWTFALLMKSQGRSVCRWPRDIHTICLPAISCCTICIGSSWYPMHRVSWWNLHGWEFIKTQASESWAYFSGIEQMVVLTAQKGQTFLFETELLLNAERRQWCFKILKQPRNSMVFFLTIVISLSSLMPKWWHRRKQRYSNSYILLHSVYYLLINRLRIVRIRRMSTYREVK